MARSILITDTDSYEETFYEEINPELQINFQDYLKREAKSENEILDKDILFVNENSSYDINGSFTDLESEKFVEIL